jgi:cytidylate kinase
MSKLIIIAIDGFSSTGKSTIAKLLAKKYNYIYVDSGAMYRAVTLYAKENQFVGINFLHTKQLISNLKNISLSFKFNKSLGFSEMYLNHKNVEKEIRSLEVSQLVSRVSAISEVRRKLVQDQQLMGLNKGIVMDGRDIGTVVFPEAELKLFMTATANERASRRYKELIERGDEVQFSDILFNVQERDKLDSTRKDSPLVRAKNAVEFDNSTMDIDEQFDKICDLVDRVILNKS